MSIDDLFAKLGGSSQKKPDHEQPTPNDETAAKPPGADVPGGSTGGSASGNSGLSSLDVLTLPADQRRLINWLTRSAQATVEQIAQGLNLDSDQVMPMIAALRRTNFVTEAVRDGQVYYRVAFRTPARQKSSGLMSRLLSQVTLENKDFLKQIAIFSELAPDQLQEIVGLVTERDYAPDEVILGQGSVSEYLFFVKSGIVAISRVTADHPEGRIVAYLKPGDILGEYSVMSRSGATATATATASSRATMLMIRRGDFLALLNKYPAVTVEVVRILVHRLLLANDRSSGDSSKFVVLAGAGDAVGVSVIGNALAMTLASVTQKKTGYTELPGTSHLPAMYGLAARPDLFPHPAGFDVVVSAGAPGISPTLRATLIVDQLTSRYHNAVVKVDSDARELLSDLASRADQLIVVTTPGQWDALGDLLNRLRAVVRPERTAVFTILNRVRPEEVDLPAPGAVDFDIPYLAGLPSPLDMRMENRPEPLAAAVNALTDRLGRANQVSLYIPTTIDVNQAVDTSVYVERTLAFLGERFGGATTSRARGVWNSTDAGLVGEDIHIVRSYATQADLDKYMKEILNYVESLKVELKQEAMAVEINQRLMLI